MQQTEIKDPCRYCTDWKWHCRGMCIKKMAYEAVRMELGNVNEQRFNTTKRDTKI